MHAIVWMVVLGIPFLLRPDISNLPVPPGMKMPPSNGFSLEYFLQFRIALLIGFFYFNHSWLVPRYLISQRRRWTYFALVLLCFLVLEFLLAFYLGCFFPEGGKWLSHGPGFLTFIFLFGLSWAASSGIQLNAAWERADERQRESENARLNVELTQLKSQLNPHFLFNTLNGIYTLALAKDDAAPDAVMKLSHLLRYVMAGAKSDFVPLQQDLEYLAHFIELHKMRLTDQTPVSFTLEGDPGEHQIAPLLLLTFVENAIKFGSSTRELSPVEIGLKITPTELVFTCKNQIRDRNTTSTGIGIANAKRRLELLYPGAYGLEISERSGAYTLWLKISQQKSAPGR